MNGRTREKVPGTASYPTSARHLETGAFRAALVAILLLAAALRFYRLGAQSYWNDEGTSVALALRDLATITRNAAGDIHPPLYYYGLHAWVRIMGPSEAGARSLSAVLGVALVGGVYLLGRRLLSPIAALLAALFAALSPFMVYYSQEARMYIPVAFLGVVSVLALERLLTAWAAGSSRRWAWLLAYALSSIAAIYTHYMGLALLLAHNLIFVAWIVPRWRAGAEPEERVGDPRPEKVGGKPPAPGRNTQLGFPGRCWGGWRCKEPSA
jgi:mannosyltransferase